MNVKLEREQIKLLMDGLKALFVDTDLETRKRITPLSNYLAACAASTSIPKEDVQRKDAPEVAKKQKKLLTKQIIQDKLQKGHVLEDMLDFREGQECWIFKSDEFIPGPEVIYIPDTDLNEIPVSTNPQSYEEIEDIISMCYTGDDFLQICDGDVEKAERLFHYVDWQHPSSALMEIEDDIEDEDASAEPGPIKVKHPYFYWLEKNTFCLEFDGGVDEDGDKFTYICEHHLDEQQWVFERLYEDESIDADFTEDQKQYIIYIMEEQEAKSC